MTSFYIVISYKFIKKLDFCLFHKPLGFFIVIFCPLRNISRGGKTVSEQAKAASLLIRRKDAAVELYFISLQDVVIDTPQGNASRISSMEWVLRNSSTTKMLHRPVFS